MRTNLKVFRIQRKMTQKEFAKVIGCSLSQYGMIEQGQREGKQTFWNNLQTNFNIPDGQMWELMKLDKA